MKRLEFQKTEDVKFYKDLEQILQDTSEGRYDVHHAFAILQDVLYLVNELFKNQKENKCIDC